MGFISMELHLLSAPSESRKLSDVCTLAIALLLFFLRLSVFSSNVPLLDEVAFADSNLHLECQLYACCFFCLNVNII